MVCEEARRNVAKVSGLSYLLQLSYSRREGVTDCVSEINTNAQGFEKHPHSGKDSLEDIWHWHLIKPRTECHCGPVMYSQMPAK